MSDVPESVPGGQLVPPPDPAAEVAALAVLLTEVVDLTRTGAVYPGRLADIAEEAQGYASVRSALRDP
ncbi:MAG: hypothetical protein ACRDS1_11455 [Pseudonocardiaceae bacterium]